MHERIGDLNHFSDDDLEYELDCRNVDRALETLADIPLVTQWDVYISDNECSSLTQIASEYGHFGEILLAYSGLRAPITLFAGKHKFEYLNRAKPEPLAEAYLASFPLQKYFKYKENALKVYSAWLGPDFSITGDSYGFIIRRAH